ncbi:hypothetical protein AL036_07310 [Salipiger aestuarii]|uniref:Uncharacterized protein DUF998 n=1 Tax=Salipiger aestuarii TaxID=568098 RepID=A0A327YGN3_9RHOB|nr:DUF998 domain-containing protein [Salipiger aestuarii]EIE51520.1 hypothetical protein C357_08386 [Citreicella sp. 357]KAA8608461.1 hypothetical protein AL036_07310 [Salipiger aestuarii]KAA8612262.1 hypothetical protein AL037_07460 [Salipiger aestuarii]KAB2541388.1 hypothetical protein AL035_12620 [Salipiger aestuarii]RAK20044.1 uncharacterized protein DUF998 [Salipiger aestuarii]
MNQETTPAKLQSQPKLMIGLGWYSIIACVVSAVTVLIADFVVPDHDWIADTISDLAAGDYEFIVDIGIYALSSALIATALLAAHVHMDGWRWSIAIVGLAILGLIVFLIGARNEYGDNDSEGVVIHVYLVYVLGFLMAAVPALMAQGAGRAGRGYQRMLIAIAVVWVFSAPVFFFLPTGFDGIYERYLALITFAMILTLARLFIKRGQALDGR